MAIVGGATYVARAFSGKQKHMVETKLGTIVIKYRFVPLDVLQAFRYPVLGCFP
jgi:hypothetical protein